MYDNIEMTVEQQRKLEEGKIAQDTIEPPTPQRLPSILESRHRNGHMIHKCLLLTSCLVAIVAIITLGVVAGTKKKDKNDCNCIFTSSTEDSTSIQNLWYEITPKGKLPPERLAHAAETVSNEYLYIHGGMYGTGNISYNDIWRYHQDTNTWEELQTSGDDIPSRRLHHSMVNINNEQLLIFGGFNVFNTQSHHDSYNDLYSFDLSKLAWKKINANTNNWPTKRGAHDAVYVNGLMYMFGGYESIGSTGHLAEFWSYDPRSNLWTDLTQTDDDTYPVGRIGFTMADGGDGKIYLFGGACSDPSVSDSGQCSDSWKYEPFTNQWTRLYPTGNIPDSRRATHGDIAIYGLLFQYGGVNIQVIDSAPSITMFDDLHVYDPTSNMW
eukprot:CAMPEP_0197297334 /NCGR_PEP_ID=MMETSP0890-20130614/40774_1 /TAXON_ID=44058 ORGANISM="Aureoumbra lagunensis, Strain CCMP1510" /NCGR_SAMPLE_ID=MMETSP0890 /ASSEMBLY_ACC=CAM_ASM_000533 /LENGTH=381 /DNA_ID=CAMNT_0042774417 /DNA_START=173 /DNA_END=1315 /DNA_ORIENTATION=-